MFILNLYPIVKRAERPEKARDTVRGARIIESPVKLFASTLRRQRKLRLVVSEMDLSQSASRRTQATKQQRRNRLQHRFKKSESSKEPDARKIEEDSRHLALIMACLQRDCKCNKSEANTLSHDGRFDQRLIQSSRNE